MRPFVVLVLIWGGLCAAMLVNGYLMVQLFRKKSRNDFTWVKKSVVFRNIAVRERLRKALFISDRTMIMVREQNPELFS